MQPITKVKYMAICCDDGDQMYMVHVEIHITCAYLNLVVVDFIMCIDLIGRLRLRIGLIVDGFTLDITNSC